MENRGKVLLILSNQLCNDTTEEDVESLGLLLQKGKTTAPKSEGWRWAIHASNPQLACLSGASGEHAAMVVTEVRRIFSVKKAEKLSIIKRVLSYYKIARRLEEHSYVRAFLHEIV